MADFIFHDPSGRRARRAELAGGLGLALLAALVAAFFATLAFAPTLPVLHLKDPRVLRGLHVETAHRLRGHRAWTRVPHPRHPGVAGPARPLNVGFYVSWDESSRESLARHVEALDVVAPQWIALDGARGRLTLTADPQAEAIIKGARKPPSLLPVVHNVQDSVWNGPQADAVILDPAARHALTANLTALAKAHGYAGYVFDLENLSAHAAAAYPAFLAELRAALKPQGRELWVTAPFADDSWPLKRLQAAADVLVLMAYDQHWGTGDAGSPAGQAWFQTWTAERLGQLDPARTILALGAYGYDWTLPAPGKPGRAEAVTFNEATQLAHDAGASVAMDPDALNPRFAYADDAGAQHVVWFLDAATLHNQLRVADPYHPLGYALWRLGAEDPDVWGLLPHAYGKLSIQGLDTLSPGQDVNFDGTGEVLHVAATPRAGKRTLETDPRSGLIAAETYEVMPTSYVIDRYGARPGLVALTFDDGPDPRWTPKILDILKAKQAPATFFVIGENMEKYPGLVRREVAEGQTVGGHTWTHPNIAQVPKQEAQLELNATQRLFETLTGKSLRLFRPPYFGDAEPSTPSEVEPLLVAQALGAVDTYLSHMTMAASVTTAR